MARKHLELIVKQMFSRICITVSGDTDFSIGDTVEDFEFERVNKAMKKSEKELAKGKVLILGIAEVALTRSSFLSSVSFQHATKKLVESSIAGSKDRLAGLKENVIIGRLIPAGSGFQGSKKYANIKMLQEELSRADEVAETVRPPQFSDERT